MKIPQVNVDLQKYSFSVKKCVDSNWVSEGPISQEFVNVVKSITGTEFGVLAPNGTLAEYLALQACGIGSGDEVIVPNTTFIATATAVIMAGATPVFVDVGDDLQIDPDRVRKSITEKTKAVIPVHLFGNAADVEAIRGVIGNRDILIIEDACQALGVESASGPCGSLGDVSFFSFFADKVITTGEGGYIGTNLEWVYDNLLLLRNQGRKESGSFIHPSIGYNFRMTDLQTSLGLAQLEHRKDIFQSRRNVYKTYESFLPDGIVALPISEQSIPFRIVIKSKTKTAAEVMDILETHGIEPRSCFFPLHRQPCFKDFVYTDKEFPNSISAFHSYVCLPTYPSLTTAQIQYICKALQDAV